jgi:hypothetical protein
VTSFQHIAPYLKDPLVLAGFAIFLFFSFCRHLVKRGIIPQLNKTHGYKVVQAILLYGFLIGLVVLGLGFGLKYRELSREEQSRAVSMLATEFEINRVTVSELARNLESMLGAYDAVARGLRSKRIPVLATLFPENNLRQSLDDPTPAALANQAIAEIAARRLHDNKQELAKADAVGKAIVATIKRTRVTLDSLADAGQRRYSFRDEAYRTQLPILRKIDIANLTAIEADYADLTRVRNSYDAVVVHLLEYLSVVEAFFAPANIEVTEQSLTRVLAAERMAISTLMAFTPDLLASGKRLDQHFQQIRADQRVR